MRGPLSNDDLEELDSLAGAPEQLRAAAARIAGWAEEVHPDDERITPARLLVSAGEHLAAAGDHEAALELFRRAVTAQGHVFPDVRCYLHDGLLQVGDTDSARDLADELRRERPTDPDVYRFIGEGYESADDLVQAHRWFTMGVTRMLHQVVEGDGDAAADAAGLMLARRRVRRVLDLPADEYDTIAELSLDDD